MSENIIYCYSGSGNCLDMAKNIAKFLGDTDIVLIRKEPVITDTTGYKRVGFVVPCYAGGLPGGVEENIRKIRIAPESYRFGIIQYAAYMGCGLHKINNIVGLDYWSGLSNHCSAIWLMPHYLTIPPTTKNGAQKRSETAAKRIADDVRLMTRSENKPPKRIINAIESAGYSKLLKLVNGKMYVNESCIGCGQCAKLCPKENIKISNGRAEIGTNCIGCMSCVEYCPKEAINVGKVTVRRERFHNSNISANDLMETMLHIE